MTTTALPVPTVPFKILSEDDMVSRVRPIEDIPGLDIDACYDHIIVLRAERPTKTDGGIELVETVREAYHYGYAARVGPRVQTVARGDWIMFAPEGAREVEFPNATKTKLCMVAEATVFGRCTIEVIKKLKLVVPNTDLMEVLGKTMETASGL